MARTYTIEEIGQRVKDRSPGKFDNFTDKQIGERMLVRNPKLKSLLATEEAPKPKVSFLQDAKDDLSGIKTNSIENLRTMQKEEEEALSARDRGEQGKLSTFGQVFGAKAKATARTSGEALLGLGKALLPQKAEDAISGAVQGGVQKLAETDTGKQAIEDFTNLGSYLKENHPVAYRNLRAAGGVTELGFELLGIKGAKVGSKAIEQGIKGTVKEVAGDIPSKNIFGKAADKVADILPEPPTLKIPGVDTSKTFQGVKQLGTEIAERVPRAAKKVIFLADEAATKATKIKGAKPNVANAIKAGLPETIINTVGEADTATRKAFRQMFDIADTKQTKLSTKVQPSKVAGDAAVDQVDLIVKKKQEIGEAIGAEIDKLDTTKGIKIQKDIEELNQVLRDQQISIDKKGKLDFSGSKIAGTQRTKLQQLYDSATEAGTKITAKTIKNKDQLFSTLKRESAIEQVANIMVKTPDGDKNLFDVFRDVFNARINQLSPEIAELNRDYSKYVRAMDDIENSIFKGPKLDIIKHADQAEFAKVNLRRIMGEAQSSPAFEAVADLMDGLARELGYTGASPKLLIAFAEELRRLFPEIIPKAGFQGGIKTSVSGAADIISQATKLGTPGIDDQVEALRKLLGDFVEGKTLKLPK